MYQVWWNLYNYLHFYKYYYNFVENAVLILRYFILYIQQIENL